MKLVEAIEFSKKNRESNRGITVIRRVSWPEEDYLQIMPNGKMSYWDNTEFAWQENYVIPLKDTRADDWIVLS